MARSAKSRTDKTQDPAVPDGPGKALPDAAPDLSVDSAPLPDTGGSDDPAITLPPVPGPEPESEPVPEPEPGRDSVVDRLPDAEPQGLTDLASRSAPEPTPAASMPLHPASHVPVVTVQKVGFAPIVLGGIIAALLGYAAAYIGRQGQSDALDAALAAQIERISTLESQIAALPAAPDTAPIIAGVAQLQTDVAAVQADLAAGMGGLDARLTEVEKAPNADGTLSDTAIAAWDREMEALRAEIGTQQARMQELADAATVQLDQTRVEAATIEQNATDAAAAATARAALSRVQAAMDSGTPFDAALGDLAGVAQVPEALTAIATDGVPTLSTLQAGFPDAARAALAVARGEGLAGEGGGGIAAFLRNQLDIRSVTPQSGDTADAILSRAEDALRNNRLSDALAEIGTLPEVIRAEMSGWISAAETRNSALAAVESLSQTLPTP